MAYAALQYRAGPFAGKPTLCAWLLQRARNSAKKSIENVYESMLGSWPIRALRLEHDDRMVYSQVLTNAPAASLGGTLPEAAPLSARTGQPELPGAAATAKRPLAFVFTYVSIGASLGNLARLAARLLTTRWHAEMLRLQG